MGTSTVQSFKVIRGEKGLVLDFYLTHENTGRPFDLTGITELEVKFPGESATIVKLYSLAQVTVVDNTKLGHIQVPLSDVDTLALKVGESQPITLTLTYGSSPIRITDAVGVLNVYDEAVED